MTDADHESALEPAAAGGLGGRSGLVLLVALLAVSGLLRFWYLPHSPRITGELRSLGNVEAALAGDRERDYRVSTLAWYPQYLVLRLADRLHDAGGGKSLHVATARDNVTRRGHHLARAVSVLYGLAGVVLLYLVARRLHSAGVALLAALALSFSPWHIQSSVAFAPEILVLALSLLALWLAMRALDEPAAVNFALVGLALGAAAAAKVTGALVAVPVLLGLALAGRREPRRLLLPLAISVPVAVVAWWALTPPYGPYSVALELEQASQVERAAREMSSRFTVAALGLLHPLRESVHGRLLGALALLGAAGQAFRCLFLVDPGPARAHRLMVVAAAPVFALGYAWATPLYRESSFVPLVAYSSLYAAVMLGTLWQGLMGMQPRLRTRWAVGAAVALTLALVVPPGWLYVHAGSVESTVGVALDWLRRELGQTGPRVVLVEKEALRGVSASAMELARGVALSVVPRLVGLDGERLAHADAVLFPRRELTGAEGSFYLARREAGVRRRVFEAKLLRRRGPDLVAVLHPYGSGAPQVLEIELRREGEQGLGTLPPAAADVASLALLVRLPPTNGEAPLAPRLWLDGVEVLLAPGGRFPRHSLFLSERLDPRAEPRRLEIAPPDWAAAPEAEISAAWYSWR